MKKIAISFLSLMFILGIGLGLSHFGVLKNAERVKADESEFVMVEGASFRSYWSTSNCGITFGATLTDTNPYVNNVRLFIAPYDFVETVANNPEPIQITDYIQAFNKYYKLTTEEQAKQPVVNKYYTIVEPAKIPYNGVVSFFGGLKKIQEGNESRRFFGIYYYYDSKADKNEYAIMPNGEVGQARSIAYLASGHYNTVAKNDEVVTNDEYMTSFWMERAIKTAVGKSDKKVDISSISYIEGENKTATILGGILSGTYFDDFLTISGTRIRVEDKVIDVGQRLNFKVDYTNFRDYINQNDKKGHLINVIKVTNTGSIVAKSRIGRDDADYTLTINPYDLKNARLSSLDTTFTDTISGGNEVVDTYNDTNVSPSTTLIVPKGANMLAQKEIDSSLFTSIGSVSYEVYGSGENGDLADASTDIIVNGKSTLEGNKNCINSVTGTFNATKNKFNLMVNYCWDDAYNPKLDLPRVDGSTQANTQEKQYFYKQTHTWQQLTGYKTYLSLNRNNQADTILVQQSGTHTVYYAPETYNAILNCEIGDRIEQITTKIKYDYPFTLNAPNVEGYTPTQSIVGPYFMTSTNGLDFDGLDYTILYRQTDLGDKTATYLDNTNSTVAKFFNITNTTDITGSTEGTFAGSGGYSHQDNSNNWDKYFVGVGKESRYFSKAATFNFEFEFKYGQVGTFDGKDETASRLIITFAPESSGDMYGISINLGGVNSNSIPANAISFFSKKKNDQGVIEDVYTDENAIKLSSYIPDFNIKDQKWHKIAVYKFDYNGRGCVNLSIDDYRICEAHLVDGGALSNLFGNVYFGIQAYCTTYEIRNANYTFGEGVTAGNIGLPINDAQIRYVKNDGEIVIKDTDNDTVWAGNGGVIHNSYSNTSYLFGDESAISTVLQGKSVYYEFNLNLSDIYPGDGSIDSEEKASKFLCIFGQQGGDTLFGAYLDLGGYSKDGYENRKIQNVGFAILPPDSDDHEYKSISLSQDNYVNYTDTIKIGCYKYVINNTAYINLYINDVLVAKSSDYADVNSWFTDVQLVGNVRFGFKGYRVKYSISNAKYICSNNDRLRIQETKMSNTVAQENFYFESKVYVNAYMPGNYELENDTSLGGIVVQSVEDISKQWYFYMEINDGDSSENNNRRVGLVPIVNGVTQWKSEYKNYYNINKDDYKLEKWKRAESIVYVSKDSYSFIDSDGNLNVGPNDVNVLSVYKYGKTLVFMLNSVPYLFVEDDDFAGKASVGFRSDGYSLGFKESQFISKELELTKIAKERSIITNEVTYEINDGITFDGELSEAKWQTIKDTIDGKNICDIRCSATDDNNGEKYKFRAFLGKNFLYVGIEAYSLSCYGYEGGVVLDEIEYRILWHNFNMEISGIRNNQVSQTAFNVIGISIGVANFGYTVVKEGDLYHIIAEVAIPYESFGLTLVEDITTGESLEGITMGASLVENITFAVRPGLYGTSASYKQSDTFPDGYTDENHHVNENLGGEGQEGNINVGYWWNDGKIYYVTGAGVGILGSSDA